MKEIKDMNREELLEYIVNKKKNGASYQSLANVIKTNNIDDETRRFIMNNLDSIDESQKKTIKVTKKKEQSRGGILNLIIGILIVIFGFILFVTTSKSGIIFIFNFIVWGFGALLIIRGISNIIASKIK